MTLYLATRGQASNGVQIIQKASLVLYLLGDVVHLDFGRHPCSQQPRGCSSAQITGQSLA